MAYVRPRSLVSSSQYADVDLSSMQVERNKSANKQLAKDQAKGRNKLFKKRSEGQKKRAGAKD